MASNQAVNRRAFLAGAGGVVVGAAGGGLVTSALTNDSSSTGKSGGSSDRSEIVIASPYPLSGPLAADGEEMKNGSALAIKEINAAGGVAGRKIRQIVIDADVLTPDGVTNAMNKAVSANPHAIALGYFVAWEPSVDIAAQYGAPMVHDVTFRQMVQKTADNPKKYGNIFQTDPSEDLYGSGLVTFLTDLEKSGEWKPSAKRIFIVEGATPYSHNISVAVQEDAKKIGWTISGVEVVTPPVANYTPIISKIKNTDPGVVIHTSIDPTDLAAFQTAFAANPSNALVYLQYGASVPAFLDLAKTSGYGVIWATVIGVLQDEIGQKFQKAYQAEYNKAAGFSNSGGSYDQIYMLAQAWGQVGDPTDFEAVNTQLRTQIFRGVCGGYRFDNKYQSGLSYPTETNDPGLGMAHLFFQIQDGKQVCIAPSPYNTGTFKRAAWQS